jgi:hypothetical protein
MLQKEHTLYTEKFRPTDPADYVGNDGFKQDLNQWIEKQDYHIYYYMVLQEQVKLLLLN